MTSLVKMYDSKTCDCEDKSIHHRTKIAGYVWAVASFLALILMTFVYIQRLTYKTYQYTNIPNEVWLSVTVLNVVFAFLMIYGQKSKRRFLYVPYLVLMMAEFLFFFFAVLFCAFMLFVASSFLHHSRADDHVLLFGYTVIFLMFLAVSINFYFFIVTPIRSLKRLNKSNGYDVIHPVIEFL